MSNGQNPPPANSGGGFFGHAWRAAGSVAGIAVVIIAIATILWVARWAWNGIGGLFGGPTVASQHPLPAGSSATAPSATAEHPHAWVVDGGTPSKVVTAESAQTLKACIDGTRNPTAKNFAGMAENFAVGMSGDACKAFQLCNNLAPVDKETEKRLCHVYSCMSPHGAFADQRELGAVTVPNGPMLERSLLIRANDRCLPRSLWAGIWGPSPGPRPGPAPAPAPNPQPQPKPGTGGGSSGGSHGVVIERVQRPQDRLLQ